MQNKRGEEYQILQELEKGLFEIQFTETTNIRLANKGQIARGTCYDLQKQVLENRKKKQEKLKTRARATKAHTTKTVIPSNILTKTVLSIDLATRTTGLVLYNPQTKKEFYGLIRASDDDYLKRANEMITKILRAIKKNKVNFVLVEGSFLGMNSSVLIKLSECRGMLLRELEQLKIPYVIVPPIFWKSKFASMPNSREQQKKFILDFFEKKTKQKAETDDVADAYAMFYACTRGIVWQRKN